MVGLRVVLLLAAWDGSRVPVSLRSIGPPRHAAYRSATALLRAMGEACVPPRGAPLVSVGGAAAEGSQAPRRMGQERAKADTARRWGLGCALARPWKTAEEKTIKNRVPPGPQTSDQRTRGPREQARHSRKTLWTLQTRLGLRHSGAVTVGLSKRGRHLGPTQTKILLTTLAEDWRGPVCLSPPAPLALRYQHTKGQQPLPPCLVHSGRFRR